MLDVMNLERTLRRTKIALVWYNGEIIAFDKRQRILYAPLGTNRAVILFILYKKL